jgi:hypothetical protein
LDYSLAWRLEKKLVSLMAWRLEKELVSSLAWRLEKELVVWMGGQTALVMVAVKARLMVEHSVHH